MNIVIISGRLTKKPELRSTTTTSVCQFSLAVDNGKTNEDGKRGVDFIECVCFGKTAENLCKYQDKGNYIEVKGRLQVSKYTNNEGKNATKTQVSCGTINYISTNKTSDNGAKKSELDPFADMGNKVANDNYELPF